MNKEETRRAVKALVEAYHSTTSPAATIKAAIAKQGREATEYALAYIVNYYHWDGRISRRNKDKAAQINGYEALKPKPARGTGKSYYSRFPL